MQVAGDKSSWFNIVAGFKHDCTLRVSQYYVTLVKYLSIRYYLKLSIG